MVAQEVVDLHSARFSNAFLSERSENENWPFDAGSEKRGDGFLRRLVSG